MNHDQIIELLPWYANQTLEEDERQAVEAHLAGCSECAKEMENLSAMRKAVVETENQGPTLSAFALNRALAEVEDYERTKAPKALARGNAYEGANWWARWWKPTPLFARALVAAQIVLVLALGTVTFYQHTHPTVIYTTASGGPTNDKGNARIVVRFSEGASEQEIRQTILAIKGKIVDGPSAQHLYTIQLSIPTEQTAEIERVLETLRQNQRVIVLAEQVQ
ncbi:MAG TPA: zf-HC2 domain-containing protein [Candidatus Angelobacter sp.]